MGALEEDVELERGMTKAWLEDGNITAEMKEGGADGGMMQMTTLSTARTKGQSGTGGSRSLDGVRGLITSGEARRAEDPGGAEEAERQGDTEGPEGQGRAMEGMEGQG